MARRQSTEEMGPTVFRKQRRIRWRDRHPAVWACSALLALYLAHATSRAVVQLLVDDAALSLKTFRLSHPDDDSIYVSVEGARLATVNLPLTCTLQNLNFDLQHGSTPVGRMSSGLIPLGYGGSVPVDIGGRLHISHREAFRELSQAIVQQPDVPLTIAGTADVRIPWLGISFGNIRLVKHMVMLGANGLDIDIRRFTLVDGAEQHTGSLPSTLDCNSPLPSVRLEVRSLVMEYAFTETKKDSPNTGRTRKQYSTQVTRLPYRGAC